MPPVFGGPRSGYFYPQITYNAVVVDFDDPLIYVLPEPAEVRGSNVSFTGLSEVMSIRQEQRITLVLSVLQPALLASLYTWWSTWACFGKQSALVLDRFSTCTGQWEYDQFNTYFDKAECVLNPFQAKRVVPARTLHTLELIFRQGSTP